MKIAVLCNYELLPERVGGMDTFFWAFDKKCKSTNIEVDWYFPNAAIHGDYKSMTIKYDPNKSIEDFFLENLGQPNTEYTHIITHFLELCTPFFYKIKQVSKAKIIAVDHNPRPLEGYPVIKRIKKRIKGLLFSRYINLFVGVSEYTVKELIKDFGKHIKPKTQVIYNGINTAEIEIRTNRAFQKATFLVASHLRQSKGIQDLIQAVALLPEPFINEIKIDIYGDGPHRTQLVNLVQELKLDNCFDFKGSSSELKSLYCRYDYLLHPSHEETFCYSVLEAMAANVIPITTEEGGNVLKIIENGKNGFLFRAKDITKLSLLIAQIWKGENRIEANTRNLIEERFTIDKMVNEYLKLLN